MTSIIDEIKKVEYKGHTFNQRSTSIEIRKWNLNLINTVLYILAHHATSDDLEKSKRLD